MWICQVKHCQPFWPNFLLRFCLHFYRQNLYRFCNCWLVYKDGQRLYTHAHRKRTTEIMMDGPQGSKGAINGCKNKWSLDSFIPRGKNGWIFSSILELSKNKKITSLHKSTTMYITPHHNETPKYFLFLLLQCMSQISDDLHFLLFCVFFAIFLCICISFCLFFFLFSFVFSCCYYKEFVYYIKKRVINKKNWFWALKAFLCISS